MIRTPAYSDKSFPIRTITNLSLIKKGGKGGSPKSLINPKKTSNSLPPPRKWGAKDPSPLAEKPKNLDKKYRENISKIKYLTIKV